MFKCESCRELQPKYSQPKKLVVESRNKMYFYTKKVYNEVGIPEEQEFQSNGWEIVREINICKNCYQESKQFQETVDIGLVYDKIKEEPKTKDSLLRKKSKFLD